MKQFAFFVKIILSFRYKVTQVGTEALDTPRAKILLPNHPAMVDPQILLAYTFSKLQLSPVIIDHYFKIPILSFLFKKIGAVPVSDLQKGSRDITVLNTVTKQVLQALNEGRNIVIYPSGELAGQGYEKIFNKQAAYSIVKELPDNIDVIAVRFSGLWGSVFSRAWEGKSPDLLKTLLKGFFYLVANFFIFIPKRNVSIYYENITDKLKQEAQKDKTTFNQALEQFYNKNGEEEVSFIKHYWFFPKLKRELPLHIVGSVKDWATSNDIGDKIIPQIILEKIKKITSEIAAINSEKVQLESYLVLDLGINSLMMVEIIQAIEDQFAVSVEVDILQLKQVSDLCLLAMGEMGEVKVLKPCFFENEITSDFIKIPQTGNILQLGVDRMQKKGKTGFSYDNLLGQTSHKEFLLKAIVVSSIIKKEVKGKRVGIMLPASQSSALLIFASYIAHKVPVMLNWTVGQLVLEHCVKTAGVEKILTASTFFDKIKDQLSDSIKQKCVFLDHKVPEVKLSTKLIGLCKSRLPKLLLNYELEQTAVILFTSGSESLPKAVPLTHQNIVSNLKGILDSIQVETNQTLLGFLPPFHSFGFTVLTILPIIANFRVVYTPDPTDSKQIVRLMKHTQSTMLLATPTFLRNILAICHKSDLKSLKFAVTGAESLHPSLKEKFEQLSEGNALIIEGYGITECSPIISINPIEKQKNGSVGKPINNVDVKIVDLESNQQKKPTEEGMILVAGTNVFHGYLDSSIHPPFQEIDAKTYYRTGDLGYFDNEGYLFITGRLKRFIKIAGEMISLPFIENILLEKYGQEETLVLAIEAIETKEKPIIGLFSILELNTKDVNDYLRTKGVSSLVSINKFYHLEAIPVLGTGKTDYKVLKGMIN